MRLMTHNMLKCNVKGVENGYPLLIESSSIEIIPYEYNAGHKVIDKLFIVFVQK